MTETVDPADLDVDGLFHLVTAEKWAAYQADGTISPPSMGSEGFVHCSWGRQVAATVGRHFAGVSGLLALRLDPAGLGETPLVEEDSTGSGQTFPHAYGPIPVAAVLAAVALDLAPPGEG